MGGPLERAIAALRPMPESIEPTCRESLEEIASSFTSHAERVVNSVRRKTGISDLNRISDLADELGQLLCNLHIDVRNLLTLSIMNDVTEKRRQVETKVLDGNGVVSWAGPPGGIVTVLSRVSVSGPNSGWQLNAADGVPIWQQLRELAYYARYASSRLPPDRGGTTNMASEKFGTAKGQLAINAIELVEWRNAHCEEPIVISGTTEGALYRIVAAVYEHATGKDAENAAFERPVRDAHRLYHERLTLAHEFGQLCDSDQKAQAQALFGRLTVAVDALRAL